MNITHHHGPAWSFLAYLLSGRFALGLAIGAIGGAIALLGLALV